MNLSIKNVPDHIMIRLRERARRQHRSLQGELMAIIESATLDDQPAMQSEALARVLAEVRRLGAPTGGEAATILRADRDRLEHRSIADREEGALETYEVREPEHEPAAAFYTRLSKDHGSDIDLEKIIQGSRRKNPGPDF